MSSQQKKKPSNGNNSKKTDASPAVTGQDAIQNLLSSSSPEIGHLTALMDAIGDPISIQDRSFNILYQNEAHKRMIGSHAGEICYKAYNGRDSVCDLCPVAMSFRDGQTHTVEKKGAIDRGILAVEITASSLMDSEGKIVAGIEVVRDITARRKSEEALRQAEEQFRSLVEHSIVGIYIFQDDKFQYINPKAADIFGYDTQEISSVRLADIFDSENLNIVENNIASLLSDRIKITHSFLKGRKKDGTEIDIESQGTKTEINGSRAIIGTFLDITNRRKMEAELQKVQKLESLSSFAGSIAHEYNNILTAIIGNLALAKMYAKPGYEVYDVLSEAEKASLRAKDLTSQLLSFSREGSSVKKIVILKEFLKDTLSIFQESDNIFFDLAVPENIWQVEIDESQIGQALNAVIMYAKGTTIEGGRIRISVENMNIAQGSSLPLREGRYAVITVRDQSGGIPEERLETIFDPFMHGDLKSGSLGLAASFAAVQKHNGHITAESIPGTGTIFRIYLPAMQEQMNIPAESLSASGKKGKILVMDDEEIVRVVINRLLLQCGFEAEFAKDGVEMLRMYREAQTAGRPFSIVILDLIIQDGMGGEEAMKHLLAYDPDARVIISSGLSNNPMMANFRKYGFSSYLPKPYRIEELKRSINDAFSGPSQ